MTYHHIGHLCHVGIFCCHAADVLTVSEYCHTVRQRLYLMHLVGDDNNGLAVITHLAKHLKQFLCLLRCQHRGRLVQNEDVCAPIKHLHNLHRLFLGNRHIINLLFWIYFKAIFIADLLNLFGSLLDVQLSLQTQNNIFCCGKNINQFKMLMHHTDS